jgi:predicted glutamine amidotransferase
MCLIIHKPKDVPAPADLLRSAADFNRDGFGIMAFDGTGGVRVSKRSQTRFADLLSAYRDYEGEECVIHLRKSTRGVVDDDNTHPFRINGRLYMAHNGTLPIRRRLRARSDTWHLVHDYLKPLLRERPEHIHDAFFKTALKEWLGAENKLIFMDGETRSTLVFNREHGVEREGLWLSNVRWFDAAKFGLDPKTSSRAPGRRVRRSTQFH